MLIISSLCRLKCKSYLRSKTYWERDYKNSRNLFEYVVCKMMTIFVTRLWCVKVDPFVGNWSNVDEPKRRQPKRRQAETSTQWNFDRPKRRQTIASTNQNFDIPKHRQTKTSTDQNVDKPKQPKKCRHTKTSTDVDTPKRRQTKTWTVQVSNVTLYNRVFVFIILGMYYIYTRTYLWLVGCTLYISTRNFIIIWVNLHISTSKIKSILGGITGVILKIKNPFERLTIKTDVCTEVV